MAAFCFCLLVPAHAQKPTHLSAKLNVVKVRNRGGGSFADARLNMPLATGDNVRTGARSKAEITFADKSIMRSGELSDVVVRAGYRQKDVNVETGKVYGDYKGPGRFRGRYAVAAVRGTQVEFDVLPTRTVVRCWSGSVVVAPGNTQLLTGKANSGDTGKLTSDALLGETENWIGAKIVFLSGAGVTAQRTVTGFDPNTGTIAWDQPLPNPVNATAEFLVISPANTAFVVLRPGEETFVLNVLGALPQPPYPTAPLVFAGGDEYPWMMEGFKGDQQTFLTGQQHEEIRLRSYQLDNARDFGKPDGEIAFGVQTPIGNLIGNVGGSGSGGNIGVGIGGNNNGGNVGVGIGGNNNGGNVAVGVGSGNNSGGLDLTIGGKAASLSKFARTRAMQNNAQNNEITGSGSPTPGSPSFFSRPSEIGYIAYTTNHSDTSLFYGNSSFVLGKALVRVGGRIGSLARAGDSQFDEYTLRYRSDHIGDIQVGRFHWFPGPVSNGQLGRLVSFTTVDGVLWRPPTGETVQTQLAYFDHINPLVGPRVGGYSARVSFPVRKGRIAASMLAIPRAGRIVGMSADVAYPLLSQELDIYGEYGIDSFRQHFSAIGFALPGLYHRFRADVYLEYSFRENFGGSWDLDAHIPLGHYVSALLTLSKPGSGSWNPGIGIMAQF